MEHNRYDVFISYSRMDYKDTNNEPIPGNVISQITSAFKKNHISFWIDENGIYTGDNFAPKIAEAIKNSSVFVFVSTENSNSSQWTQNEVCVAQQYKKPILPIKCDDSVYATSVIMYLAMLDYCDFKNMPETAIQQLVDSVKEKLPHDAESIYNGQTRNEVKYKEAIIASLSDINHQFVDISQIAVNQVLEANERSREAIEKLRKIVDGRSDEKLKEINHFREDVHLRFNTLCHMLDDRISQICYQLEQYGKRIEETNIYLERLCGFIKSQLDTSNINNSICQIANIIFVIDVSGSMEGKRIETLNTIMNRLTSRFDELYNNHNITFLLSVLTYSSNAEWMYENAVDIKIFKWKNLEANGLTNFGQALDKLRIKLSDKDGIITQKDKSFPPLIIFITDGGPTDNWEQPLHMILKNGIFHESYKRVIAIGDDVSFSIFSQLSYQGITKTRGDFDVEYAISDIISGYINEISSNRMPLLKNI